MSIDCLLLQLPVNTAAHAAGAAAHDLDSIALSSAEYSSCAVRLIAAS